MLTTKSHVRSHRTASSIQKAAWRCLAGMSAVVCLALVPASAMARNVGAGEMDGGAHFNTPVPSIMQQAGGTECVSTTFSLVGRSVGAAQATSINGYVGQLSVGGDGASGCETASGGSGSITRLTITSTTAANGEPFVSCPGLSGTYLRAASAVVAIVTGSCTINKKPDNFVTAVFHGEFVPAEGQGFDEPITDATFAGAYTFLPL